ncbi:MAG: hypothetical protein LCI00_00165 [Chloroflexi bacterium]|nr:hypothetical protein [Chloroflexota bacterium]MCC6894351.1 hypothetical protein [Anaerolineae bacterium]
MFHKPIRLALLLAVFLAVQSFSQPVLAQANTPQPETLPLTFNQTVSGQLRGKGESLTYRVEVPDDQDVVFAYRTTKFVSSTSCFYINGEAANVDNCRGQGGGGGDGPLSLVEYIATHGKAGQEATLTIIRPLEGLVSFQLTAYALTPETVELGGSVTGKRSAQNRFQVYTLEADPMLPFTVNIEDETQDGGYLWAAYQPYLYEESPATETQRIKPLYIDGAAVGDHPTFTSRLYTYYLGGNSFRVLVEPEKNYILNANSAILPTLSENQTINMSVSYRQPIWAVRLEDADSKQIKVNFKVTSGTGAIARLYQAGNPVDQSVYLGTNLRTNTASPLSSALEIISEDDVYVVVQIPFDFTRETVNVDVSWQVVD